MVSPWKDLLHSLSPFQDTFGLSGGRSFSCWPDLYFQYQTIKLQKELAVAKYIEQEISKACVRKHIAEALI